jgi:hypothetical protein
MATATKKEKKKLTLGRPALVAGTQKNLKQSILRLSISMQATFRFSFVFHWSLSAAAFGREHRYLI